MHLRAFVKDIGVIWAVFMYCKSPFIHKRSEQRDLFRDHPVFMRKDQHASFENGFITTSHISVPFCKRGKRIGCSSLHTSATVMVRYICKISKGAVSYKREVFESFDSIHCEPCANRVTVNKNVLTPMVL